jgi:hypothetical protein
LILTDDTFFNYARKYYDNPSCRTALEFSKDIRKFGTLKVLMRRFSEGEDISLRLILNHIMILFNIFMPRECIVMLFFKLGAEYHSLLKTFLLGIGLMPDTIPELGIKSSDIAVNEKIAAFMRSI